MRTCIYIYDITICVYMYIYIYSHVGSEGYEWNRQMEATIF